MVEVRDESLAIVMDIKDTMPRECNKCVTICQYCKSHDHIAEDYPILQRKWQDKRS